MNVVMDSSALIAFLRNEPGADFVQNQLTTEHNSFFAHAINLCEVYYDAARRGGEVEATKALEILVGFGLTVREDMDFAFWRQTGNYKAELARISLADCFCLALANRLGGEIVTADHHEFDRVAKQGLCKVQFIR